MPGSPPSLRPDPDELRRALSAFTAWRDEILAFFAFLPLRLSNGFVEGKNNRTKALMRQAYGYRNRRSLRARILGGAACSCFPLKDGDPQAQAIPSEVA